MQGMQRGAAQQARPKCVCVCAGGAAGRYAEVYLVTALVPSETACLASSPGRHRRTAVWISREVSVLLLLTRTSCKAGAGKGCRQWAGA